MYYQYLLLPFRLVIEESTQLADETMVSWKGILTKTWMVTSKMNLILSHCCIALIKVNKFLLFANNLQRCIKSNFWATAFHFKQFFFFGW